MIRPSPVPPITHLSTLSLLRSYALNLVTSRPWLLNPSIRILASIAHSSPTSYLSPDRNPLLHWLLKNTIYRQFCAGENPSEVRTAIERLRGRGIGGLILCYAREIEVGESLDAGETDAAAEKEINAWADGVVKTMNLVPEGGFVSIKFSGAGSRALHHLSHNLPPPELLSQHLHMICSAAVAKKVKLCIDAEQSTVQAGIDAWTIDLMRTYNRGWACIHNTYQTYLISSPTTLAKHLRLAREEDWILGVKLVRGAYLASEDRKLFWPTKEATDNNFDAIAESLITKSWGTLYRAITEAQKHPFHDSSKQSEKDIPFPKVAVILATHNLASCRKALYLTQSANAKGDVVYAQLQGMADHVTGELLATSTASQEGPLVCKYLTWGTVTECTKYLLRRAEENRDAARNSEGKTALASELGRRFRALFGA